MADLFHLRHASNQATVETVGLGDTAVILLCECGHPNCGDRIVVTVEEFERAQELHARVLSTQHAHLAETPVLERSTRYVLVVDRRHNHTESSPPA